MLIALKNRCVRYEYPRGCPVELSAGFVGKLRRIVAERLLFNALGEQVSEFRWFSVIKSFVWYDERTGWRRVFDAIREILLPIDVGFAFKGGHVAALDRPVTDADLRAFYAYGAASDGIADFGAIEEPESKPKPERPAVNSCQHSTCSFLA